ncbi:MAG: SurA N-terminal domain-containing protein [Acidobacteria bacterium]|nr:SurA N-terminal domain-containing protein [Acidobacteriota bacterium]MBV9624396.1 SurA N-terminal domain-containing protein [Acidobacteriota bacterium]
MLHRALIAVLFFFGVPLVRAGEVLDRLVATVNGHAVLASDWEEELRYESFMAKRPLENLTAEDRSRALDHLIDQELVVEQMHSAEFKTATGEEIERQLVARRNLYGEDSWSSGLRNYGISEAEVCRHIELELNQWRLVEARLRPAIEVDGAAIESYYREELVPKIAPAPPPPLAAAAPTIRELLIEKKINQSLDSWLQNLRSQAQIRVLIPEFLPAPGEGQ